MIMIKHANPRALAYRAFTLAYHACGSTQGLGFLQARAGVTEVDVRDHLDVNRDRLWGDYIFGRMVKLAIEIMPDAVVVSEELPDPAYQGWCHLYPTYARLIRAAAVSLELGEVLDTSQAVDDLNTAWPGFDLW